MLAISPDPKIAQTEELYQERELRILRAQNVILHSIEHDPYPPAAVLALAQAYAALSSAQH